MRASTKSNLHKWSSVTLIIFLVFFLVFFLKTFNLIRPEIQNILKDPISKFLLIGFILNSTFHARLELWNIYDDYFKLRTKTIFQIISYIILVSLVIVVIPIIGLL